MYKLEWRFDFFIVDAKALQISMVPYQHEPWAALCCFCGFWVRWTPWNLFCVVNALHTFIYYISHNMHSTTGCDGSTAHSTTTENPIAWCKK